MPQYRAVMHQVIPVPTVYVILGNFFVLDDKE